MASQDTPAGRLHTVLAALQPLRNSNLETAWSQVLHVDTADRPELFRQVALVVSLPDLVERSVRALPGQNYDLLLRWRPKADEALRHAHVFEGPAATVVDKYDSETLHSLEWADDLVLRATEPPHMEADTRAEALDMVVDLLADLDRLDWPPEIRALLIEYASGLEEALRLYPLTGADGVVKALRNARLGLDALVRVDAGAARHPVMVKLERITQFVANALQIGTSVAVLGPQFEQIVRQITQ